MKNKITVDNCKDRVTNFKHDGGDLNAMAAAWVVVIEFCEQQGMKDKEQSGIENVIGYIAGLKKQIKKLKLTQP